MYGKQRPKCCMWTKKDNNAICKQRPLIVYVGSEWPWCYISSKKDPNAMYIFIYIGNTGSKCYLWAKNAPNAISLQRRTLMLYTNKGSNAICWQWRSLMQYVGNESLWCYMWAMKDPNAICGQWKPLMPYVGSEGPNAIYGQQNFIRGQRRNLILYVKKGLWCCMWTMKDPYAIYGQQMPLMLYMGSEIPLCYILAMKA